MAHEVRWWHLLFAIGGLLIALRILDILLNIHSIGP